MFLGFLVLCILGANIASAKDIPTIIVDAEYKDIISILGDIYRNVATPPSLYQELNVYVLNEENFIKAVIQSLKHDGYSDEEIETYIADKGNIPVAGFFTDFNKSIFLRASYFINDSSDPRYDFREHWLVAKLRHTFIHELGHAVFFISLTQEKQKSFLDFLPKDFNRDIKKIESVGWNWRKDGFEAFAECFRILYSNTLPRELREKIDMDLSGEIRAWFRENLDPILDFPPKIDIRHKF